MMAFSPELASRMMAAAPVGEVVVEEVRGVDGFGAVGGAGEVAEGVAAELADEADVSAGAGGGDGLVGAFAAGAELEADAHDGFAPGGEFVRCGRRGRRRKLPMTVTHLADIKNTCRFEYYAGACKGISFERMRGLLLGWSILSLEIEPGEASLPMSYPKIRKAVFPAAGMGTRFLPATKAIPKEMLCLVDKPLIQYGVEEAVAAGCTEIIIVTGRDKAAMEDHFDSQPRTGERRWRPRASRRCWTWCGRCRSWRGSSIRGRRSRWAWATRC